MSEHPIPFTGWSIGRILAHQKTQTRRLIRLTKAGKDFKSPFGMKGDRLWVKEVWAPAVEVDDPDRCGEQFVVYRASTPDFRWTDGDGAVMYRKDGSPRSCWRPPMFMPRWAARIFLVNEGERVERLNEITEEDAVAEGITEPPEVTAAVMAARSEYDCVDWRPSYAFADLWNSIYGKKPGGSWDDNPRVRVLSFKLLEVKG